MTDTRHRLIDRPIKILRHQSAGLQKCSMKAGHSLFSLFTHSPAHATRSSWLEYRTRFLATPPAGILEQTELTLPPSQLAARGSRLEYRTRFLAAPPARILEQKRDCSQSKNFPKADRIGKSLLVLLGCPSGRWSSPADHPLTKKPEDSGYEDRSQKPLSMREMFPPSMLQNGGRQIRFCHVVSRPASLLAENFSLKTWAQ